MAAINRNAVKMYDNDEEDDDDDDNANGEGMVGGEGGEES